MNSYNIHNSQGLKGMMISNPVTFITEDICLDTLSASIKIPPVIK